MELQAVMEKRRSIRNYNPERKVTKEQLEELIKAASYAPSWKNLQTSRYYCVLSENKVKELRECSCYRTLLAFPDSGLSHFEM